MGLTHLVHGSQYTLPKAGWGVGEGGAYVSVVWVSCVCGLVGEVWMCVRGVLVDVCGV